jgi:hypothetical protein
VKYIFLIIGEEESWANATEKERQAIYEQHGAFAGELAAAGKQVEGHELALSDSATQLRFLEGGGTEVVDGPFVESKEQLGGYYLFECADLDEALRWAAKIPMGPGGVVEIRPVVEVPG